MNFDLIAIIYEDLEVCTAACLYTGGPTDGPTDGPTYSPTGLLLHPLLRVGLDVHSVQDIYDLHNPKLGVVFTKTS